jgi:hypothetical protein
LSEKIWEDNVKNLMLLSMAFVLATGAVACKPTNPQMTTPHTEGPKLDPVRYDGETKISVDQPAKVDIPNGSTVTQPAAPAAPTGHATYVQDDELTMKYNPKVDILFVMDTSDSMYCDQDTLKKNINKFTDVFLNKQGRFLDFHIGVVTAWDSINFGSAQRNCELGELRPLGGPSGAAKGSCIANGKNVNYVTRETPNLGDILGKTLKVGTETFIKGDAAHTGPEQEELFSPVIKALSPESAEMNSNFRRADEAHLAVIFLSDTDDATPNVSSSSMAAFLKGMARDNLSVSTYAVLARYNDLLSFESNPDQHPLREYPRADMKNCSVNPVDPAIRGVGGAPFKMRDFLVKSGGTGFDLKDRDFGKKLGDLGESIVRKSLRKVIELKFVPDLNQDIIVKYGKTQKIPRDDIKGWSYDQENQTIIINEGVSLEPEAGARITLEYTPVKAR